MTTTTESRLDRIEQLQASTWEAIRANQEAIKDLMEHGKQVDDKLDRAASLILELAKRSS